MLALLSVYLFYFRILFIASFSFYLDKAKTPLYNFDVCSRSWRNRHTRTFEGRVRQRVRVQVPSTAHTDPDECQDLFLYKNTGLSDRYLFSGDEGS